MQELVITAVGPDRPGLVDQLTRVLLDHSANVADSRMVNLHGQFALILLAQCPINRTQELTQSLEKTSEQLGMTVTTRSHGQPSVPSSEPKGVPFRLKAYAMDQPGIVHRITNLLHQEGVNIEELQTRLAPAAYSGTPLFNLDLGMTVPSGVSVRKLRQRLEELSDELNCDVSLEPR
jgi:glycine cleavage system transcriptional repressor